MREFDRGYSEVTFSKLAALTGAREAIIHKEFHLSSCDPKLVGAEAVTKIGRTNFDVADQLANMGDGGDPPESRQNPSAGGCTFARYQRLRAGRSGNVDRRPPPRKPLRWKS